MRPFQNFAGGYSKGCQVTGDVKTRILDTLTVECYWKLRNDADFLLEIGLLRGLLQLNLPTRESNYSLGALNSSTCGFDQPYPYDDGRENCDVYGSDDRDGWC